MITTIEIRGATRSIAHEDLDLTSPSKIASNAELAGEALGYEAGKDHSLKRPEIDCVARSLYKICRSYNMLEGLSRGLKKGYSEATQAQPLGALTQERLNETWMKVLSSTNYLTPPEAGE